MSLANHEKLRKLQRALYAKAKQEPAHRFHFLYDRVWREDILAHVFALSRDTDSKRLCFCMSPMFARAPAGRSWAVGAGCGRQVSGHLCFAVERTSLLCVDTVSPHGIRT